MDEESEEISAEVPHSFRNLGRALSLLRGRRDISLRETAVRAGVGVSQLSKYENGRTLPRLDSLGKILSALDLSLLDIVSTMTFLDQLEEGGPAKSPAVMLSSALQAEGLLGNPITLALRKVVDDLMVLQETILAENMFSGVTRGRPK